MNATQLLAHFDRLAETPDAVPRLRRFILDLAVRGKLVEQDAGDEPAAALLKQIESEIARLVKIGEMRKPKALPPIEVEDEPFDVPTGWRWVRIRQVTSDRGQTTPAGEFTYIDVGSINKEAGILGERKILSANDAPSRARKVVGKGDVLYSCVRPTLLNIAVVEDEITPTPIASTAFAVLNSFGLVLPRYLWIALRSPYLEVVVEASMRGQAYPAINDAEFALLPLALPPLAEQHRIVAKVDELMALCDQLEAAQQERERRRDRLVAASLPRLNQPATDVAPEAQREHVRFHLHNLPRLTTRPEHIKAIRQSILSLAVQGRLVEQNAEDGLASGLLEPMSLDSVPSSASGKLRKVKPLSPIAIHDVPYPAPKGWLWVRMGLIGETNIGLTYSPANLSKTGTPVLRSSNVQNGKLDLNDLVRVDSEVKDSVLVQEGDLLICARNGSKALVGKTALITGLSEKMAFGAFMAIFRSPYNAYLLRFINSPLFRTMISEVNTTTINQITQENLKSALLPLPPLAEQHRIVAKVDELMALCDQLEAQLTTTQTDSRRLLEAVLEAALAPA